MTQLKPENDVLVLSLSELQLLIFYRFQRPSVRTRSSRERRLHNNLQRCNLPIFTERSLSCLHGGWQLVRLATPATVQHGIGCGAEVLLTRRLVAVCLRRWPAITVTAGRRLDMLHVCWRRAWRYVLPSAGGHCPADDAHELCHT